MFQIERPALLFRLIILIESYIRQRLQDLTASIVDHMRVADKCHHLAASGGFIQHHFGMAGCDNLRALAGGNNGQQIEYLPLTKNFQVGVRFIQQ